MTTKHLTDAMFKELLQDIMTTKAASVIEHKTFEYATYDVFVPDQDTPAPSKRQTEILYQIWAAHALDVKWLIAAYHLQDAEYDKLKDWLTSKGRIDTVPELGDVYQFDLTSP